MKDQLLLGISLLFLAVCLTASNKASHGVSSYPGSLLVDKTSLVYQEEGTQIPGGVDTASMLRRLSCESVSGFRMDREEGMPATVRLEDKGQNIRVKGIRSTLNPKD